MKQKVEVLSLEEASKLAQDAGVIDPEFCESKEELAEVMAAIADHLAREAVKAKASS